MPATRHHSTRAPSSLPFLNICGEFKHIADDGKPSPDRDFGTDAHTKLERLLLGKKVDWKGWSPFHQQEIEWAADVVKADMTSEFPLEVEKELELNDSSGEQMTFGTVDVINGPCIWDLKTGKFDPDFHYMQMCCYALCLMQRDSLSEVSATILYSRLKLQYTFIISRSEAESIVFGLFAELAFGESLLVPSEKCSFCAKAGNCEALLSIVERMTGDELPPGWEEDPNAWSSIIATCKKAEQFIDAARAFVRTRMVDDEVHAPGLKVRRQKGNRFVRDLSKAFPKLDLTQEEFLSCCSISLGSLETAIASQAGFTKKETEGHLEGRLGELLQRGKDKAFVVEDRPRVPRKRKVKKQ